MAEMPSSLAPLIRVLGPQALQQIVAIESLPARAAETSPIPADVHSDLRRALAESGVKALYRHQALAWNHVRRGQDVVVVTATASGKTLSFNLPIIDAALSDPGTRALYLYPTKALANDQAASLANLTADLPVSVGVYHGDTPEAQRAELQTRPPNILISNPDTLHHNHLARHVNWTHWWRGLRFVVIDEAHAYRGVFGSHVAHVLRRVRRLAAHYGADPLFISATATIGNASEHVEALTGRSAIVIDHDGSPQAARDYVLWRPSRTSELETARLIGAAVQGGLSVIGFARSRRTVEQIRRTIRRDLTRAGHADLDAFIAVYRAGYLADRRREIEAGLRSGIIRGVVSTNALELGIDIGSLGVAVLSSYPGSTMAFRQQAGRAGRRDSPALVVMVIGENPLDEYIAEHPAWAITAGAERAAMDTANDSVASGQLGCAARELPLTPDDQRLYGADVWSRVTELTAAGSLVRSGPAYVAGHRAARPRDVNLRSLEGNPYRLIYRDRTIGDIDARYVAMEAHPGAIYLQDGEPYRVDDLDREHREVHLVDAPDGVMTRPLGERFVNVRAVLEERRTKPGFPVRLCHLHVRSRVAAYQEFHEQTRKPLGRPISIDPVALDLYTHGLELEGVDDGPGLHAVEHLVRGLAPLVVLCDPADLDGHTDVEARTTGAAYIFDRTPGGSGISKKLFEVVDAVLADAALRLSRCECTQGCPLCLHLGNCMFRNDDLSKDGAASLLGVTLSHPKVDTDWPGKQPARDLQAGKRACTKCGRRFSEAGWLKGFPYGPHNRVKGDPSMGVCSGSERYVTRASTRQPTSEGRARMIAESGSTIVEPGRRRAVPGSDGLVGRRLEALTQWRHATAARLPATPEQNIVSDAKLQRIAETAPDSLPELQAVGDFADLWLAAFGNEVLAVLHRDTE